MVLLDCQFGRLGRETESDGPTELANENVTFLDKEALRGVWCFMERLASDISTLTTGSIEQS